MFSGLQLEHYNHDYSRRQNFSNDVLFLVKIKVEISTNLNKSGLLKCLRSFSTNSGDPDQTAPRAV